MFTVKPMTMSDLDRISRRNEAFNAEQARRLSCSIRRFRSQLSSLDISQAEIREIILKATFETVQGTFSSGFPIPPDLNATITQAIDLVLLTERPEEDSLSVRYDLLIFALDWTLVCPIEGAGKDKVFRKGAADWQFLPGRREHVLRYKHDGCKIALATNQGGVAFGIYGAYPVGATLMQCEILKAGEYIGADYVGVCYTHPKATDPRYLNENDPMRKPNPGMLLEALRLCEVPAFRALMIGDSDEDRLAAERASVAFLTADDFFAEHPHGDVTLYEEHSHHRRIHDDLDH